jgi:hypothetical protein
MFKLSTSERLRRWKSIRQNLNNICLTDAIAHTVELWQSCPFSPFYLDPETPADWPDPWQLLEENTYCDLAKVLGIVYTLHLSLHKSVLEPEIRIYYEPKTRYNFHIAYLCGGKYVLNLIEDEIVNKEHINQELKLKYRYTAVDLKLEKY